MPRRKQYFPRSTKRKKKNFSRPRRKNFLLIFFQNRSLFLTLKKKKFSNNIPPK